MANLHTKMISFLGAEYAAKLGSRILLEALPLLSIEKLEIFRRKLEGVELMSEDRLRKMRHPNTAVTGYCAAGKLLNVLVQPDNPPWENASEIEKFQIPGMLTNEEIGYYHYISEFYTGRGTVVELGPWLGLSTHHLIDALNSNPAFAGNQLHVFDDFVWRSDWMDMYYVESDRPAHHGDFLPVFLKFASDICEQIVVHKGKITDYDGNESLPLISWNGGPIEFIIVDCGRTIKANQSWFDTFSHAFIPDKTLVIMQDWRLHRERPRKWYNQTKDFTDQNPCLELVHEITDGGIGTFLFRGIHG